MSDYEYFPETDCDRDAIQAALDDGSIERWRIDGEGRQWFRRPAHPAKIFAVPKDDSAGLVGRALARLKGWLR